MAVHAKRHTWRPEEPVRPWLFAIARYKAVDGWRRNARHRASDIETIAPVLAQPDEALRPMRRDVDRAVASLDGRQREVVSALSVEGRSIRQTAERLRITEGAVRVAFHRGLAAIAARFGKEQGMQTDILIQSLREDLRTGAAPRMPAAPLVLLLCLASAGAVFAVLYGPRADLASAVETLSFVHKPAIALLTVALAFATTRALARPGSGGGASMRWLAVPAGLLAVALVVELLAAPSASLASRLDASNALVCLSAIPLLGLAPLVLLLAAARRGATTRPRLAGAFCGLAAAGFGAFFYAAHCPNDSSLFVAAWYPPAAAVLVLLGALAGPRVLRW